MKFIKTVRPFVYIFSPSNPKRFSSTGLARNKLQKSLCRVRAISCRCIALQLYRLAVVSPCNRIGLARAHSLSAQSLARSTLSTQLSRSARYSAFSRAQHSLSVNTQSIKGAISTLKEVVVAHITYLAPLSQMIFAVQCTLDLFAVSAL